MYEASPLPGSRTKQYKKLFPINENEFIWDTSLITDLGKRDLVFDVVFKILNPKKIYVLTHDLVLEGITFRL